MINSHIPVMLDEVKSFIPINKDLNLIEASLFRKAMISKLMEEL